VVRPHPTLKTLTQDRLGESKVSDRMADRPSSTELVVSAAEYQALLLEVQKSRGQERDRTTRIQHLEQALDQALTSLDEMRLKLQEQTLLEAQLAATEKFACVQQQAIARLRLRIHQQQTLIESHLAGAREGRRSLGWTEPTLSPVVAPEPAVHPAEDRLNLATLRLEEGRQRIVDLEQEAEQDRELAQRLQTRLMAAQQRVQELALVVDATEAQQAQSQEAADSSTELQTEPHGETPTERRRSRSRNRPLARQNRAIATLGQDLARAQIKVEELEIELARQLRQQALWQQKSREAQGQTEHYRSRIQQLEQQATEMQEQIVYQARQVSEYEATIQHWKDQYTTSQDQIARLQELLEEVQLQFLTGDRGDPALSALFSELLAVVEFAALPGEGEHRWLPHRAISRLNALDLPDFLLRRRNYRMP